MAFKLDIFKLLGLIHNPKSGDIYESLTDDEKKGFAPLVAMTWMAGTKDERQLMALAHFANPYIFALGKHPHLLMQLLQTCSSKTGGRNFWLSQKAGSKRNPLTQEVVKLYFGYSSLEYKKLAIHPSEAEVLEMAEELGWQKDEMTKLKKEFKDA
jgi:hypothetical protein